MVIDCYNVLHADLPPGLAGLDEAGLCRAVGRTAWAASGVTVVADGRPKPGGAASSPAAGVDLIYSGGSGGRSADDVIVELIAWHSAPRRLTVVSSDRAIRAAARRRRARDWPSDVFVTRLVEQLRRTSHGVTHDLGESTRPQVEPLPPELVTRWKRQFGFRDDD
ncbi:MAG: NYN domain-containing protein [Planctomycetota bacterium]